MHRSETRSISFFTAPGWSAFRRSNGLGPMDSSRFSSRPRSSPSAPSASESACHSKWSIWPIWWPTMTSASTPVVSTAKCEAWPKSCGQNSHRGCSAPMRHSLKRKPTRSSACIRHPQTNPLSTRTIGWKPIGKPSPDCSIRKMIPPACLLRKSTNPPLGTSATISTIWP